MSFTSPRSKRGSSDDSNGYSPPASPASTPSIVSLREREDLGRYSPRAVVAGRLGELAIRGDYPTTHSISSCSFEQTSAPLSAQTISPPSFSSDRDGFYDMPDLQPSTAIESQFNTTEGEALPGPVTGISPRHRNIKSPSKSPKKPSSSPRKKRIAPVPIKMRSARRSPPPPRIEAENPFTWNDSEITGHNPTDPTDDGYGINGIGFKPTAAIAWARSQKRQKQVAEWKNREAREARERRRERRDGNHEFDKIRTIQQGAIHKRVKFDV
ncbi:hypothetical protein ARAM_002778 [Aspergillus rambellii]|uniref:Uncharacterized protein n=3 Tax=Aspergillus subgen. Nidulantes TaxID=2720870 RepID=A0A0F8U9Z9_9EURO|nr:hypothetical protein AOCH_004238 [Aspergillus ochraceoroseus]KKK16388.1 hypothetical protein ARAM_002778 [Aspergillus rambellii]